MRVPLNGFAHGASECHVLCRHILLRDSCVYASWALPPGDPFHFSVFVKKAEVVS